MGNKNNSLGRTVLWLKTRILSKTRAILLAFGAFCLFALLILSSFRGQAMASLFNWQPVLTVFSMENGSRAAVFYQKSDKLKVSNTGLDLEFQGIKTKPQKVLVQVTGSEEVESPYEIKTDVVFVDPASVSFEKTKVSLLKRKQGTVNAVVICSDEDFDPKTSHCRNWEIADITPRDSSSKVVFETTHFSAVAGAYLNLIDKHADLTVGDIWTNRFQTYGVSDLTIKTVDGTHFGIDLGFEGVFCGDENVNGVQYPDADTVFISNYFCDGKVSSIKNKELTSGRHWLSFSFGETQDERSHNFACNSGTLNDTCTVTAGNTAANGEVISGSGNLVIASGGSITAAAGSGSNPGNAFTITMTGSVTIQSGGTITGNVTINAASVDVQSGGSINVNGKGYLGGCESGCGASFQSGYGPGGGDTHNAAGGGGGASHGGNGGTGQIASPEPYGSVTQPNQVGSGGGGYQGSIRGGSGGGTIKIVASGTVTVNGTVSANGDTGGGSCCSGGGSGGSIWIDAGTLAGNASITANGGNWHSNVYGGGGAGGRIALYYGSTTHSGTVSAYGGDGSNGGVAASKGGAGTIYRKLAAATNGDLIVINSLGGQNTTQVASTSLTFDNVTIGNNAIYVVPTGTTLAAASSLAGGSSSGTLTVNSGGTLNVTSTSFTLTTPLTISNSGTLTATNLNLTIGSGGTLTLSGTANISLAGLTIQSGGSLKHSGNTTTRANVLDITASGDINIQSGGSINLNGLGHTGGGGTGGTNGNGTGKSNGLNAVTGTGGAGYGAAGGNGSGTNGGIAYGSNTQPTDLGSGAGTAANGYNGGDGGGAVKLDARNGTLTVAGSITANGTNGTFGGGGGSGGSIWLLGGTVAGNGTITANGGNGGTGAGASGGGAGGRVAIYYATKTYSGTPTVSAGTGVNQAGNAGTIYEETPPTTTITAVCSVGGNNCTAGGEGQSPQVAFAVTSLAGTGAAGASALSSVQISIKDTTSNQWYGGSSFNQGSEFWLTATSTTAWSYDTSGITWTPNRNYLVRARGVSANSWTGPAQSLNFVFATPPSVTNVSASQDSSGVVNVGYDVAYGDGPSTAVSLYYDSAATLSSTIDGDDVSITVSSGTFFPNSGTILIDSELITYTSKSGNTLQGTVTRGALSSIAVAHTSGVKVWLLASAVTGDVGTVNNGSGKTIAWTAVTDLSGHSSATYRVIVVASQGGIGTGQSGNFTFDTAEPTLSGSSSSVRATATSPTAVTITWSTDESSDSVVDYGTTAAYGTTATNSNLGTSHSVPLTGLTAGTTYYYRVKSTDAYNNLLTDDNAGASYTFTTPTSDASSPRPIDETPPVITNVTVLNIATNGVTITWTTDEETSSIVNYGLTNTYGSIAGVPDIFVISHQVTVSGLVPGTVYNYQVVSLDRNSNRTASVNATFTTATGTGSGTGDGTGSGEDTEALEQEINELTNENTALNTQVNELNAKLGSAISEDEKRGILRDLENLRAEIDNNIRRISELSSLQNKFEAQENRIKQLESQLSDITNKILGIKEGETLSPADILKTISLKFAEITRVFKTSATVAQKKALEETIGDTTATLRELSELVPPAQILTRPAVTVGATEVVISWNTDKPALGAVLFSDAANFNGENYSSNIADGSEYKTEHQVVLTNLLPATIYHYQIRVKSEAGVESNSSDFTFTTKTAVPVISAARYSRIDDKTISFSWLTSLAADSVVTYTPFINGTLDTKLSKSEGTPELDREHFVTVGDLAPATTYEITVSSTDAFGNTVSERLGRVVTSEDKVAPVINQVRTEISVIPGARVNRVQAIISWRTDEPATTQVVYDKGASTSETFADASQTNNELTFNHIAVITNWEPGTVYRFRTISKDETGNEAQSKTFTVLTPRQKATVVDLIIDNFSDIFGWTQGRK